MALLHPGWFATEGGARCARLPWAGLHRHLRCEIAQCAERFTPERRFLVQHGAAPSRVVRNPGPLAALACPGLTCPGTFGAKLLNAPSGSLLSGAFSFSMALL